MKRRPVKTLKSRCLTVLGPLITRIIRKTVSNAEAAEWYGVLHGDFDLTPKSVITGQVSMLKDFLWSHINCQDYDDFFLILIQSIENAIQITRKSFKPSSNINHYRQELDYVIAFAEVALHENLRNLDFADIPTSMRSVIIEKMPILVNLQSLALRSYANAAGQWLFKGVINDIMHGMQRFRYLQTFSLKHDCTNDIIKLVCRNNTLYLTNIDIEGSKKVNDKCINNILMCLNIMELNLFQTGLTDEGKAQLIANLSKLTHLPRGDYLCDALAWIPETDDDVEEPLYLIQEFFPSQKYYFHEDWQMEMVAVSCPYIHKMFFIYHEKCVVDYLILLQFNCLRELELYGGHFFDDKVNELLQLKGQLLTKLRLTSIKGIDYRAFAFLTLSCKKLKSLTLTNCELVEYRPIGDINSDEEYQRRQNYVGMAREAHDIIEEFRLEELHINNEISNLYLVFLISRAQYLKSISIGPKNEINDDTMLKLFLRNPLSFLEEFHVEQSDHLTFMAVTILINNCENLRVIGDLQKWSNIDRTELSDFREAIQKENYELDTSSNQRLRKYLDLREFERKTYLNLVAGPYLERLKMLERQSHAL